MIKSITIDNFKNIVHLEIEPTDTFNVIIGENNIGKTTIFEAIHLWKMCYDKNLKKDKTGFYSVAKNMKFTDMEFIRVYHDEDLFPLGCDGKNAKLSIEICIEYEEDEYKIGFSISKVSNIDDAYLQVEYLDANEFKRFAEMVKTKSQKNLASFIAINESKPIPNIIAKEPYMYKAQVLDKIAKGKSNEVLRNKVIGHLIEVQEHINNIMDSNYVFTEHDRDNKTYITIKVDGKDIFSYGSGFLQLTEIFASMEYLEPEINILLIDEPDAHLHLKLQKKLIQEFRSLGNNQLFIITHNERFLEEVDESEILFIDENSKSTGHLKTLPQGTKKIALENLKGCMEQIDHLQYATRIVAVEGQTDIDFINAMKGKYEAFTGKTEPSNVYIPMIGIDTLNAKLITYSRVLKEIIPNECRWLILRDTDCVPVNKKTTAGNDDKMNMETTADIKVIFQNGYGIESTFASDVVLFSKLMCSYYEVDSINENEIENEINEVNIEFARNVKDCTNSDIHGELKKHFERQLANRSGRVYSKLKFEDMLIQINKDNIQYIMTKSIMNLYLKAIHEKININFSVEKDALKIDSLFTFYYEWIDSIDRIFPCHKEILDLIYSD